jgi:hypothetical protein
LPTEFSLNKSNSMYNVECSKENRGDNGKVKEEKEKKKKKKVKDYNSVAQGYKKHKLN